MLIEIIRQSLYTRDIQPTSNPLQICGHLRSCYACSGCLLIVYFQIKRKSPVNDGKRQIMRQSLNSTPPVMGGAASGIRPEDYLTMA